MFQFCICREAANNLQYYISCVYFYAAALIDRAYIFFGVPICLFIHLSVCLSKKMFTLVISFDW